MGFPVVTATIQNTKLPAESQTINYCREWILRVKRGDPIPKKLLGLLPKSKLKVDAIPTLFPFRVEKRRIVSEKRAEAKISKSHVEEALNITCTRHAVVFVSVRKNDIMAERIESILLS